MVHKNELFIIGGQRSGTSFLTDLLRQHSKISFAQPLFPETRFFIQHPDAGRMDFYRKCFAHVPDNPDVTLAEKSTSYYENEKGLRKIKQTFPGAKVLLLVRDPVDRALSNYFFSRQNELETRSLQEAFLLKKPPPMIKRNISVNPFSYIDRSFYSKYIDRLHTVFSRDQILLLSFDELVGSPYRVSNRVFEFIGQPVENVSAPGKVNASSTAAVPVEVVQKLESIFNAERIRLKKYLSA